MAARNRISLALGAYLQFPHGLRLALRAVSPVLQRIAMISKRQQSWWSAAQGTGLFGKARCDARRVDAGRYGFVDLLSRLSTSRPPTDSLSSIETLISEGIGKTSNAGTRSVLLLLDTPDLTLALGSTSAEVIKYLLLRLRNTVHPTVLSCSADSPSSAASQSSETKPTPIEVEMASGMVQQVHNSRAVMSVGGLDPGAAKDLSGVLRVTRGGASHDCCGDEKGMEGLYLVQRDRNVKVFERGSAT